MLSQEQLELRKTGIGGSDAAAIFGLSKWKTPLEVFLDKTTNIVKDVANVDAVHWGNLLEPIVRSEYSRLTGKNVIIDNNMKRHRKYNFMIGNVDGLIDDGGVLECKTCSLYKAHEWGTPGTDEMPKYYVTQCAHYRILLNAPYVDLSAAIAGKNKIETYRYVKNERLEKEILEKESDFWHENVLKGIPPDPVNIHDAQLLYPIDNGDRICSNDEINDIFTEYRKTKNYIKDLEEQEKYFKEQIIFYMKNYSILHSNNVELASYKHVKQCRLDTKRLEKEYPDIYSKFLKQNIYRVFRIKES